MGDFPAVLPFGWLPAPCSTPFTAAHARGRGPRERVVPLGKGLWSRGDPT